MAKKETGVIESGLTFGVIALAIVVIFAVGLTRWHKHAIDGAVTLPATLSGGYARSSAIDQQVAASVASAKATLGAGTDVALYTQGQNSVIVQATRLPGEALFMAGGTYAKVGNATCASESDSSGAEAICQRTDNALTVQVTASDSATAAKYADEVYDGIAKKHF